MKLRITAAVLALAAAVAPTAAQAARFADTSGHWAESIIDTLAEKGVVNGISDTEFNPDGTVTRAEFLRMAMAAANITPSPYREGECLDVPADAWYAAYVQGASDKGLIPEGMISGYSAREDGGKIVISGAFNAPAPITREEMAYIAQSAYQYSLKDDALKRLVPPLDLPFEDVNLISSWAFDGVKHAYSNELIFGMGDGLFYPHDTATRAQSASIINNILERRTENVQ